MRCEQGQRESEEFRRVRGLSKDHIGETWPLLQNSFQNDLDDLDANCWNSLEHMLRDQPFSDSLDSIQ